MNYGQVIERVSEQLRISYRDYRVPLQAGIPYPLDVSGNYWQFVRAAAATEVTITFDESQSITRDQGTGGPANYARVMLLSAVDQVCVFSFGYTGGLTPYDRSSQTIGSITVANSVPAVTASFPDVVAPPGVRTLVTAVSGTRRAALIRIPEDAAGPVRIGDSACTASRGLIVYPGDALTVDGTAALYVWNPQAVNVTLTLLGQGL